MLVKHIYCNNSDIYKVIVKIKVICIAISNICDIFHR